MEKLLGLGFYELYKPEMGETITMNRTILDWIKPNNLVPDYFAQLCLKMKVDFDKISYRNQHFRMWYGNKWWIELRSLISIYYYLIQIPYCRLNHSGIRGSFQLDNKAKNLILWTLLTAFYWADWLNFFFFLNGNTWKRWISTFHCGKLESLSSWRIFRMLLS